MVYLILAFGEASPALSPRSSLIDFNLSIYVHFPVPIPIRGVTVSNVTSTGFHLAWAADLALHPPFQLTLTSTRSPTVHLETRDASLTLSGLEPGVLHLVEIVAKACETESARARLKVRTGKGFNAYHGLFLNGRKSRKKIVWWVKFKEPGVLAGAGFFIFFSV